MSQVSNKQQLRIKTQRKNKNKQNNRQIHYGSTGIIVGSNNRGLATQSTVTIPKAVNCWMPDRLKTTMRWWNSPALNLSALTYGQLVYQPTGLYDINPAIGGASAPGFNELAAIYRSYRVTASSCKVELMNSALVTPIRIILAPVNSDPGTTPTGTQVIDLADQPYAVSRLSSLRGGPITTLNQGMSTQKIFGSPMVEYDDNFASLVNTIPVNNWFWVVAWFALATIPSTEGAPILNVSIEVEVEFYDRGRSVS